MRQTAKSPTPEAAPPVFAQPRLIGAVVALAIALATFPGAAWAQRSAPGAAARETDDHDVVFFGPQGAVFIRLQIETGKTNVTAIRREYSGGVFRALDVDTDGRLSAEEAKAIPANGQRAAGTDTLGDRWAELDIAPRDDSISADELFQFVDEQIGARFRIEVAPPRLQQSAQISSQLDASQDGLVSREEVEQGPAILHQFDFDDDETLSVAELQPFPTAILQTQLQQQANQPSQLPLVPLDTAEQRESALRRLQARYAPVATGSAGGGSGVPCETIAMAGDSVSNADADHDGLLDEPELAALLKSPAPAVLVSANIALGRAAPPARSRPGALVQFKPINPEAPKRAEMVLGGMDVRFGAVNYSYERSDLINLYLVKFIEFDTDKNQYLNEAEFASVGLPDADFASVDSNGDRMVMRAELKKHLELAASLAQAAIVLTISDDAKTLFEILDTDLDNRLNLREFRKGAIELNKYDHDRDGRLAPTDLRSKYGFTVTLARPEQFKDPFAATNMAAQARQPRIRAMTAGPTWFRKMDRNQDGDLTWREFLGERADFARIDADQNGLITLEEAVAAE